MPRARIAAVSLAGSGADAASPAHPARARRSARSARRDTRATLRTSCSVAQSPKAQLRRGPGPDVHAAWVQVDSHLGGGGVSRARGSLEAMSKPLHLTAATLAIAALAPATASAAWTAPSTLTGDPYGSNPQAQSAFGGGEIG